MDCLHFKSTRSYLDFRGYWTVLFLILFIWHNILYG